MVVFTAEQHLNLIEAEKVSLDLETTSSSIHHPSSYYYFS
jgi:hypothetical protein